MKKNKLILTFLLGTSILSTNVCVSASAGRGIYIDPTTRINVGEIIVNGKRYNSVAELRAGLASGKISRQQIDHYQNVSRQNLSLKIDQNKIQFKDNTIYVEGKRADAIKREFIDGIKSAGGNAATLNENDIEFRADGMFIKGIKVGSKEQVIQMINTEFTNISDQELKEAVKDPYFLAALEDSSKQQVILRLQGLEADSGILAKSNEDLNKFNLKKQETFSGNPKLLSTYDRLINMEPDERKVAREQPEFQELLNSQELVALKNSPEMQEMIKNEVNKVNEKAAAGKSDSKERFATFINEDKDLFLTDTSKGVARLGDLTPVQKPDTITTDSMLASVSNVTDIVDTRISDVSTESIGLASGDDSSRQYGLWAKGMYTQANQGEYKLVPGYKLDQGGGTIGFDIGENAIFGIAYSYLDSTAKTKNIGMKEKIKSHIGTIYALFNAENNIFLDGQARYGKSDIKKSRNNGNLSNDVSRGKTKGELYGGKIELGYDYTLENKVHLIPTIGVAHDELQVKGYQETGSGLNRKVSKRTANKTSGLLGIRAKKAIDAGTYIMIPEVHANFIYALQAKNGKTTITFLEGMDPITTPSGKLAKASYKIGGSVKFTKLGNIDMGVGYDLGLSKKFYSHTGYLNARVNF